jgi:hypothetical protein
MHISTRRNRSKLSRLAKGFTYAFAALIVLIGTCAGVSLIPVSTSYVVTDDRLDVYQLSGENLKDADSVVALMKSEYLRDNGDGTATLWTGRFGEVYNLCPTERFQEQPVAAFCSGVLVAPDVIATAWHCIEDKNVADIRFVFGFRKNYAANVQTTFPTSDIYHGVEVIGWKFNDRDVDWALIRLDRSVENHRIAHIRQSGKINDGQAVNVFGHPNGLPAKFISGAVQNNWFRVGFLADIDIYPGNSGSPVFNSTTHEVEGIVIAMSKDQFIQHGGCWLSVGCQEAGCSVITRTTEFVAYIEWLH